MHWDPGLHGGVDEDVGDALQPGNRVFEEGTLFIYKQQIMCNDIHLSFGLWGRRELGG